MPDTVVVQPLSKEDKLRTALHPVTGEPLAVHVTHYRYPAGVHREDLLEGVVPLAPARVLRLTDHTPGPHGGETTVQLLDRKSVV